MKKKLIISLSFLAIFVQLAQAVPKNKTLKIGYANMEYILGLLPEAKRMEIDYKTFEQQLKNNLEKKISEFQEKVQDLEKGYATMNEAVRKQKGEELKQLQGKLEQLQMESQALLSNKNVELFKPVYEKIRQAVEEIAHENHYTHILNEDAGGIALILYADKEYDVSDLVLKKLGVTIPKEVAKKGHAPKK